jgi:hypothetical protein
MPYRHCAVGPSLCPGCQAQKEAESGNRDSGCAGTFLLIAGAAAAVATAAMKARAK